MVVGAVVKTVLVSWASGVKKPTGRVGWRLSHQGEAGPRDLTQLQRLGSKRQDRKDAVNSGIIPSVPGHVIEEAGLQRGPPGSLFERQG